ncbi:hypothetical protein CIB50_0000527 [Kocuria varians]|uniref:Phosphatidic acid phosphatase type 2/haloperoxidase domain-containing protein n=1 Tax=Kocuria varians TaxID=1272 RepID=A0A7D7PR05_KOCVA|nr:hypothetical protein CIB50_0000527 [Kocuria varians]
MKDSAPPSVDTPDDDGARSPFTCRAPSDAGPGAHSSLPGDNDVVPAAPHGGRSPAWAVVLSEVFQAPIVLAVLLVLVPWTAHGTFASLAWGVAAALSVCGVSLATVTVLSRQGVLSDHHVSVKEHRRPVMIGTFLLVAVFLAVTLVFHGPVEITGLLTATLAASAVVALVSPWWKISVHGMMMGGTAVILPLAWGPWGLLFGPVAVAVCVSRRVLRAHTWAQLAAGSAYGVVFLGGIYWLIAG